MSRSKNCTLTCPCGEVFSSPIYDYINVAKDPQLQYTVLAGLLNVSTCPSCGRRAAIARPLIYSDPARHLLVYVHPRSDVPEEARSLIQDERLGRLALNTRSRDDAERGQLLTIARKLASEMGCQIEVEDLPDEYTVWLYGSRRQIGALMRELAPRG